MFETSEYSLVRRGILHGPIAQWIEHKFSKLAVVGSNPTWITKILFGHLL